MICTMPLVPVSARTLTAIRVTCHLGLAGRFPGLTVTVTGGTWRGEWPGGHAHEAPGMGLLWFALADCAACLERDWPGWHITGGRGEGYGASDGTRSITCATRSQLVCRLARITGEAR